MSDELKLLSFAENANTDNRYGSFYIKGKNIEKVFRSLPEKVLLRTGETRISIAKKITNKQKKCCPKI
jgi:sulfite reductase alpha subunit-like flavoprotein